VRPSQGGIGLWRFEKRCLHKSGRIVYTESSASLIRNRNGEPRYFVGGVLDPVPLRILRRRELNTVFATHLLFAEPQQRAKRWIYEERLPIQVLHRNADGTRIEGIAEKLNIWDRCGGTMSFMVQAPHQNFSFANV
jgi:hypothetical protein